MTATTFCGNIFIVCGTKHIKMFAMYHSRKYPCCPPWMQFFGLNALETVSGNSSLASYSYLKILAFKTGPPLWNFQWPLGVDMGYEIYISFTFLFISWPNLANWLWLHIHQVILRLCLTQNVKSWCHKGRRHQNGSNDFF